MTIPFQGDYSSLTKQTADDFGNAVKFRVADTTTIAVEDILSVDIVPGSIVARIIVKYSLENVLAQDNLKADMDIEPMTIMVGATTYESIHSNEKETFQSHPWWVAAITVCVIVLVLLVAVGIYCKCKDPSKDDSKAKLNDDSKAKYDGSTDPEDQSHNPNDD